MNTHTPARILALALLGWFPAQGNEHFDPVAAEDLVLSGHAITLQIAPGVRRVRLQVKNPITQTWEVYSVAHLDGAKGYLKLRLPDGVLLSDVQLATSNADPFPYSFYSGKTDFSEQTSAENEFLVARAGSVDDGSAPVLDGTPDVRESDIWQWRGTTLYFFNQYRGLQVFDVSNAESPHRLATLRMPAVGEQMYLLEGGYVVLLANRWSGQGSELLLIKHDDDHLDIVSRFAVEGTFVESRMVGDWLYSVSQASRYEDLADGGQRWSNGLQVNALDLSDPENPVQKKPFDLWDDQGQAWWYNAVVTATPNELLITPFEYRPTSQGVYSTVHAIDISNPDQPLAIAARIPLEGQLQDKFKLRVRDGILTTVSMVNRWGPAPVMHTRVDSFDLKTTELTKDGLTVKTPTHLDSLLLAENESLFATRFDQERLYVVTFRIIDPLFVIDVSDPANLRLLGELEIPGYSTYLQPMGDKLLSVGVENQHVAVSLFDVSNTDKPSLASRVYLGGKDDYTWSEANYDEKAVGFFKDQNLLLVPFESYGTTGNKKSFQLIDIGEDSLTLRGVIDHQFQPRRATTLGNVLASVSGRELITVDAADRDHPKPLATLPIAWAVDRAVTLDDYLIQVENGNTWDDNAGPVIRVSTQKDTETILGELALQDGTIVGMVTQGDLLYFAAYRWTSVPAATEDGTEGTNFENQLVTHIVSVADPIAPVLLGTLTSTLGADNYGQPQVTGLLTRDQHLVWTSTGATYFPWFFRGGAMIDDIAVDRRFFPQSTASVPEFYVIDVSEPSSPSLAAHVKTSAENVEQSGKSVVVGSDVYFSYTARDNEFTDTAATYSRRHYLRIAQFTDPTTPVLSAPVNIPGRLEHVYVNADGGTVLFTSADLNISTENEWRNDLIVHASIYDGDMAYQVGEMTLRNGQYTQLAFHDRFFFNPTAWDAKELGLQVYGWLGDGKLTNIALLKTGGEIPHQLAVVKSADLLLAVRNQVLDVIDIQDPLRGLPIASFDQPVYSTVEQVHVPNRDLAWLPASIYGLQTLDLTLIPRLVLAQDEAADVDGWTILAVRSDDLVLATDNDFVGPLTASESWRFISSAAPSHYALWAERIFNPRAELNVSIPEPIADWDGDGFTNYAEFMFGTDPVSANATPAVTVKTIDSEDGNHSIVFTFAINPLAEPAQFVPEVSTDLRSWLPADQFVDRSIQSDPANFVLTLRLNNEPQRFVRLNVE